MDATNYPSEEREDLILNDKNHIDNMIHNVFGVNSEEPLKYQNQNFIAPTYSETDKFVILTYMKGGSSLVETILTDYNLKTSKNQRFNNVFYDSMGLYYEDTPLDKKYFDEFYKIINGESEKDLIIPIRNSYKKWISGVIQELKYEFNSSPILRRILAQDKYLKNSVLKLRIDDLSEDDVDVLITSKLKNLHEADAFIEGHHHLYNETLYNFLELNPNMDKSKVKIIDIDLPSGDLRKLIGEYYPEVLEDVKHSFQSHRDFYEKILNVLRNYFMGGNIKHDNPDKKIIEKIRNIVGQDYYYYTLIHRKYKDLIY